MGRRWLVIGAGVAGVGALVLLAWRLSRPAGLGLARSRIVVVSGDASVDERRATVAQVVVPGSTVHTGHGSACFSVHASRVCVGANGEARLADLGDARATIEAKRGTFIVTSAGDEIRLTLGADALTVRSATVAIEDGSGPAPVVRALEGSATLEPSGRASSVLAAPGAIGLRDDKKRAASADVEREERNVAQLARRWQGTAGATVTVKDLHGRVEIDGVLVGAAPASVLLDEGEHELVIRDAGREVTHERLKLKAGEKVERGG